MILRLFLAAFLTLTSLQAMAQRVEDLPETSLRLNVAPKAVNQPMASAPSAPAVPTGPRVIERIAAIVNDDIITGTDLSERMALAFFSSGLPPTNENQAKLGPQVLRGMIDETLQRQEAKRSGFKAEPAEIDRAMAAVSEQNKMPVAELPAFMASHGVNIRTLRDQIEASMLWSKVVQRELRPKVEVGDEEVNARMAEIAANAGKPEYLVAEIFLRVDNVADEPQVKAFMQGLVQQMQQGARFSQLAQQFSQGAGALQGGDLGWIQAGQLSPELDQALLSLQNGQLSEPVRDAAGYHLLLVREQRLAAGADASQVRLQLQQISIPHSPGMTDDELTAQAVAARDAANASAQSGATGCADLTRDVTAKAPAAQVQALDATDLSALPSWLGATVQSLQVGQASEPVSLDGGAAMVVLCGRTQSGAGLPSREDVLTQIGTERLELQARRLMRDLRREATIDIRIGKKSAE